MVGGRQLPNVRHTDGIEGRTGAEISDGFNNVQEAQELATVLKIGTLSINLALIRRHPSPPNVTGAKDPQILGCGSRRL